MKLSWRIALFEFAPVRATVAAALFARAVIDRALGRHYRALDGFCRVVRLSNVELFSRLAERRVDAALAELRRANHNPVAEQYLREPASAADAAVYTLNGGSADLLRDLIVLKSPRDNEKGVILLKYARTFSAVVSLLDLPRLMERYRFVLEPCWAGYCDPSILMYVERDNPVFVQCFTEEDHEFISRVGAPLVPLRMGPADWVNAEVFGNHAPGPHEYDLVMVANWAPHKRHAQLFRALATVRDRDVRVLLAGFPWGERNAADIRAEAEAMGNPRISVEIVENLPHEKLAALLGRSKLFVFLSRKEGDNKALVEAMFAGVPALVYDQTVGGARSRINERTGRLTSDAQLADGIRYMLDHHADFSPREWALANTGAKVTTARLDEALRAAALAAGERYTCSIVCKVNAPNLAYEDTAAREQFRADYEFVLGTRRAPSTRS